VRARFSTGLALAALALPLSINQAMALAPKPEMEIEKASDLPDPQKVQKSSESLVFMRSVLKEVLGKLEEARQSKDVVKLNCVNDKLTQIKGLLRISEQSDVSLQESVAKHETTTAEHEYTKVSIAKQKVAQLRVDAEECVGQLAFRTDNSLVVEVTVPEDITGADVTDPPAAGPPVVRPPPASPTL
jgi:hypothetical protein